MIPEMYRTYLLTALGATPTVLGHLVAGITDELVLDTRPDPDRFTLREIVAHLADYEDVFAGRILRARDETEPELVVQEPSDRARDGDYAHADFDTSRIRFAERRKALVSMLGELTPDQWDRTARHPRMGIVMIKDLASLIPLHDGYHMEQICQWLGRGSGT